MTIIHLTTTNDDEHLYMRVHEYEKNRLYWDGSADFRIHWNFLVLACSRMSHEDIHKLHRAAIHVRERKINKAYANWDISKEDWS